MSRAPAPHATGRASSRERRDPRHQGRCAEHGAARTKRPTRDTTRILRLRTVCANPAPLAPRSTWKD
eukprot:4002257-Prymnesium_polylepis.1